MLKRKYLGLILLLAALVIFTLTIPSITGNVIYDSQIAPTYKLIITAILLTSSVILLTSKISLEAILIPCSNQESLTRKRAKKAAEKHQELPEAIIVASGGNTPGLNKHYKHEAQIAYEELRKAGIKTKYLRIEGKARDSFDNIRLSLLKIPYAKHIGIVSNPLQIAKLEKIIEQGKKEGKISKDITFYGIPTKSTFTERAYEKASGLLTDYVLRTEGYGGNMPEKIIKRATNYIFRLGSKK